MGARVNWLFFLWKTSFSVHTFLFHFLFFFFRKFNLCILLSPTIQHTGKHIVYTDDIAVYVHLALCIGLLTGKHSLDTRVFHFITFFWRCQFTGFLSTNCTHSIISNEENVTQIQWEGTSNTRSLMIIKVHTN